MAKNAKIEKSQKRFIEAMKRKFQGVDVTTVHGVSENRKIGSHITLVPYREK